MRRVHLLAAVALLALGNSGCSPKAEDPRPPRTPEQQRAVDSTVGASGLPGARGVQGALAASDSAAARRAQLDSIAKANTP